MYISGFNSLDELHGPVEVPGENGGTQAIIGIVGILFCLLLSDIFLINRKKRVTVRKTIDVIIGTCCILEGLPLLHDDRDFDPMVSHLSLKVLSPE
jgi:hypothetical protein